MKIVRKIEIAAPAAAVWKVLGDDFVSVHEWMAGVGNSVEITEGYRVQNAPAIGRMAEITPGKSSPRHALHQKLPASSPFQPLHPAWHWFLLFVHCEDILPTSIRHQMILKR